jgi:hypothetical protein
MSKNAQKLYYPIKQAIESILPICDEFVVALGDNDEDDKTLDEILQIKSEKIKIIRTVWDTEKFKRGTINAHQTNIAKQACSGDWLIYLQADEIIHEQYLETIVENCKKYLDYPQVEGFLTKYIHFFGDYNHHNDHHGWYKKEIRIIRNHPHIYSFISAQSFRRIPNFDGVSYRDKTGTFPLNVIEIDAYIYHYGWVRPPELMQKKNKSLDTIHHGKQKIDEVYKTKQNYFDYGNLKTMRVFKGTHPKVMQTWIAKFDWADKLNYGNKSKPNREKLKHEKLKYRILTFFERYIFGNKTLIGYKNWNILNPKKIIKK